MCIRPERMWGVLRKFKNEPRETPTFKGRGKPPQKDPEEEEQHQETVESQMLKEGREFRGEGKRQQ